jgi:Domain of unknown function (DUF4704)
LFLLIFQASYKRTLFSVSFAPESSDKTKLEAKVMDGTKLCSRRLLKEIIYCVGGVSVFFPLLTRFDKLSMNASGPSDNRLAADVIDLVASVLDGNASNQQQMHLLSGFGILGFLFQSVPPWQLNMETFKSLKYMFSVLKGCGMYASTRPINTQKPKRMSFIFIFLYLYISSLYELSCNQREQVTNIFGFDFFFSFFLLFGCFL